ncbi:MAG: hypothetical protein HYZ16_07795, partial [Bacteroidetes bacterium]|nr:hypothetical protein [Bacteroidota bacterium]
TETTVYIDGVFEHKYSGTNSQSIIKVGGVATVLTGYAFDGLSGTSYELSNHLGSVSIRLDDTGGVIDREEYYPFGDSSVRTWSGTEHRYVGKEKDQESGLYYYGARYYSAWTCGPTPPRPELAETQPHHPCRPIPAPTPTTKWATSCN